MALDQARLDALGVPESVISPGSIVDDAPVLDASGRETTLYAVLGDAPGVLVFYRGGWCPYCNIALRNYQLELLPSLMERGIQLVALTPQLPDASLSTVEKNELDFAVLTDLDNKLANFVGILSRPSEEVLAAQRGRGLDIAADNNTHTADLPMPTVIVLDANRIVRFIDVHPNYTTRTEASEILAAIEQL